MAIDQIWMVRMNRMDGVVFCGGLCAVIASRACAAWLRHCERSEATSRTVGVESAVGQLAAYSPTILGLSWSDWRPSRLLRFARNDGEWDARNDRVSRNDRWGSVWGRRTCITAVIASRVCAAWQSLPYAFGVESALGQMVAYSPTVFGLAWSDLFPSRLLRHFVPRNDGEWGARSGGGGLLRSARNDGAGGCFATLAMTVRLRLARTVRV